jgi:hypothetical protein
LRITETSGVVRAVTVTKNVFFANWVFNVHVWDTTQNPPHTLLGQFDLGAVFGTSEGLAPMPWDLCARVVGGVLTFKAWRHNLSEPVMGDRHTAGRSRCRRAGRTPARTAGTSDISGRVRTRCSTTSRRPRCSRPHPPFGFGWARGPGPTNTAAGTPM